MTKKIFLVLLFAGLALLLLSGCTANKENQQDPQMTNANSSTDTTSSTSTISTVETDGIQMPYAKIGSGSKTLVILPGLSIKQVSPLIDAVGAQYQAFLDNDYTIYLFDRRTNAPENYSIQDMAQDTATCMKQLGITKADVSGVSQGGMMALYIAAENPEMIDHLLLCSTCAKTDNSLSEAGTEWIKLAQNKQEEQLICSFGSLVYSDAVWEANKDAIIAGSSNITDEEYARFITMAKATQSYDCSDILGSIMAKTFIIGSEGDKVINPECGKEIASTLSCDSYFYDASYGHAVYDEAPDYVGKLLEFCQK